MGNDNKLTLAGFSGHIGNQENEKANELTKKGTEIGTQTPVVFF